jgi:hypothetical protein
MPVVLTLFLIVFLLEHYVMLRWNPAYCTTGVRIFSVTLRAPKEARAHLTLNTLEPDTRPLHWLPLAFHRLPDGRIAFRSSFMPNLNMRRHYPVMRGLVEVDARRNEVRVIGLLNWNVPAFILMVLVLTAMMPGVWPMLLSFIVFVMGYGVQRNAFLCVVEALRIQLSGAPPHLLLKTA